MLAAEAGAMRTAEVLLAAPGININCTNPGGGTALFPAARHGHQSIVRRLLAAGANVNHADHNGWNALMLAAEHGQEAVAEELLATPGIDVHAANLHGGTALFPAARHGHEGIVQRLLVAGCNAGAVDGEGMAAAAVAVQHGRHELAGSLAAASRMQLAQTD
jgi:ankyrin repeat protein